MIRKAGGIGWRTAAAVVLVTLVVGGGCKSEAPRPIVVSDNTVTVHNLTADAWQNVEVWLNYYYRVTKSSVPPGERFVIPLNTFVAGYGQRFDVRRQVVQTIQVKAATRSGAPVSVMFGDGPRR